MIYAKENFWTHHYHKTAFSMLLVAIAGITMLFAGLTSGYIVRMEGSDWEKIQLPIYFIFSTIFVALSSISVQFSSVSKIKRSSIFGLILASIFGIAFLISQFYAFSDLISKHIFLTGTESSASGSYLYVIVLAHLVHIVFALIASVYVILKVNNDSETSSLDKKLITIFWHFLGVLWIAIYMFLMFI